MQEHETTYTKFALNDRVRFTQIGNGFECFGRITGFAKKCENLTFVRDYEMYLVDPEKAIRFLEPVYGHQFGVYLTLAVPENIIAKVEESE